MDSQRRPRQYAADIVRMKTAAEREAAIEQVPPELRDWVRDLVDDYFWRQSLRRHK